MCFFSLSKEKRLGANTLDEESQSSKSFSDAKQATADWLFQLEKRLELDEFQLTFLPVLEDKLEMSKDIQNELRDKRLTIDFIQKSSDELAAKSSADVNTQLKADMKALKSHYQTLNDIVSDRISRLEKLISDLRLFHDDYTRTLNALNRIDANLQIEHHSSGPADSASHGKTIEAQLGNLKQVKCDLDNLYASVNQLNEQTQKYLYAPNADPKFTFKLKNDINDLNDKMAQLRNMYTKKQYMLEDALTKSTKVDNEIEELENWISYKEHEILDDEGILITEEQFDQRKIKYKVNKSYFELNQKKIFGFNVLFL